MHYCYILYSAKLDTYYTSSTSKLEERIKDTTVEEALIRKGEFHGK